MSLDPFAGSTLAQLATQLSQTMTLITETETSIATLEGISITAGHTYRNSQNAAKLIELRNTLQTLKNTETGIRAAQATRTAVTVTQATQGALVEGVGEVGAMARLGQIGRLLGYTGRAATVAGGVTATVGFGTACLLTYLIASGLGSLAGGSSVQAGPNGRYVENRPEKEARPGDGPTVRDQEQAWQIVKVPNMGGFGGTGIYSIRTVENIKRGIPYAEFRHGGMSNESVPDLQPIGSPTTREKAAKELASMITGGFRRPPLAGGMWGTIGGQIVTIDDYGPVSISEIQGHLSTP